jgi:hypothetical protein
MPKSMGFSAARASLAYVRDNADVLLVLNTAAMSYAQTTGNSNNQLVSANISAADFSIASGSVGPVLTIADKTGHLIQQAGLATHIALTGASATRLLLLSNVCAVALTVGHLIDIPSWTVTHEQSAGDDTTTGGGSGLAFPGAVGWGRLATGGRFGTVIHVTNLNDSGTGSLRAALQASGARTIVFDVAGTITLTSRLSVTNGNFTLAGETAPSPGIEVFGFDVLIAASNFIIRHMTFRGANTAGSVDSLGHVNGASNGIIDHCTIQWGGDESLQFYSTNTTTMSNITVMNCLILECIGTGNVIFKGTERFTFFRNVMAFAQERHPRIHGGGSASQGSPVKTQGEVINCMSYNCAAFGAECQMGDQNSTQAAPIQFAFVNNWWVAGANTDTSKAMFQTLSGAWGTGTQLYFSGNSNPNSRSLFTNGLSFNPQVGSAPTGVASGIDSSLIQTAGSSLETDLLLRCGARPNNRDTMTSRVITKITGRTGSNSSTVAGYGGHTAFSTTGQVYNEPANPQSDGDSDGYTNLEEDLHSRAAALLPA